jgi:hypothetical protein
MGPVKHQIIHHKDKFNNSIAPKPDEIETITTFHNFTFDMHEGCPLFYLMLHALHPTNLLCTGIARENQDGSINTKPLTAQSIADILKTTSQKLPPEK